MVSVETPDPEIENGLDEEGNIKMAVWPNSLYEI